MTTGAVGRSLRRSGMYVLGSAMAAVVMSPLSSSASPVASRSPAAASIVSIAPRLATSHPPGATPAPAPAPGTSPRGAAAGPTLTTGGVVYPGWVSSNWSGYAVSGGPYTSVSGQWTVPVVTPTAAPTYSVTWLGIDGFAASDPSIIQVGTDQRSADGLTSYGAWWTTSAYSYVEQPITDPVGPGDTMAGFLTQVSGTSWRIYLADTTRGWALSIPVTYSGPGLSAEWIMEAPYVNGQPSTLASYSGTGFDFTLVNGTNPALLPTDAGEMVPPDGLLAESSPSVADTDTDGFNLAYGFTPPLPSLS